MDFKRSLRVVTLALLSVVLVSCGGAKRTITDVKVNQSTIDNDSYLHLDATLNLGNITLPSITGPILIPGKGEIGQIQLGQDFVDIDLNLSEVIPQLQQEATLPNGARLPIIGVNPVVVLPIRGTKMEVYVSLVNGAPALGVSIPVRQLDSIGVYSAFFPTFQLNKLFVAGGIYSSENAGESGIGAFFDLGGVIDLNPGLEGGFVGQSSQVLAFNPAKTYQLDLGTESTSRKTQRKIDKVIYKLNRKRAVLEVE